MKRNFEKYIDLGRSFIENHYKTEASKSTQAAKTEKKTTLYKFKDFFENNLIGWVKHYIKSRFGPRADYLSYDSSKNPEKGIYRLNGKNKIILVSDWANDTDESDYIGAKIKNLDPDYTIHLGDTYYVGASFEIKSNFINEGSSWHKGRSGSFVLLGNHEMYARGVSYFRDLLPEMGIKSKQGQGTSYMSLQNDHWIIIGLDTGYNSIGIPIIENIPLPWFKPDCRLEDSQVDWLKNNFDFKNDKRGIVLLSHHQYCSAFEGQYLKPAEQLAELIGQDRTVLWYWGHEHRLALYGKYRSKTGIEVFGRCIGHGGMPIELVDINKIKKAKATVSNLILFDNRKHKKVEKLEIGHNGYLLMTIENQELTVEYFDEKELLITETWNSDITTGKITGQSITIHNQELNTKPCLYSNDINSAIR